MSRGGRGGKAHLRLVGGPVRSLQEDHGGSKGPCGLRKVLADIARRMLLVLRLTRLEPLEFLDGTGSLLCGS